MTKRELVKVLASFFLSVLVLTPCFSEAERGRGGISPSLNPRRQISLELCKFVDTTGSKDVVQVLLDSGADLNYRCPQAPHSLAHLAVFKHRIGAVKLLLDRGLISPNAKNRADKNSTLLFYANDKATIQLLLDRGADPTITNDKGELPQSRAKQRLDQAKLKWDNFTKDESRYKEERGYNTMDELREKQRKLRKGEGTYFTDDSKKAVAKMESLEGNVKEHQDMRALLSKKFVPKQDLVKPLILNSQKEVPVSIPVLQAIKKYHQAKLKWDNFTKDESRYKEERGYNTMDELREKQQELRKGEGKYFTDDSKKAVAEMESLEGDVNKYQNEILSRGRTPSLKVANKPPSQARTKYQETPSQHHLKHYQTNQR